MKPYFDSDGVTIYHGDAREVLPALPSNGCVITDPPYNVGYHYDSYHDRLPDKDYRELLVSACRAPSVVLHYPIDIMRLSAEIGMPERCIAWVYHANTPLQWRMVAWFGIAPDLSRITQPYKNPDDSRIKKLMLGGRKGAPLYDWWHIEQVKNISNEKTEHPCQIPAKVMQRVVGVTDTAIVIDPFMGSGTTLQVAQHYGIRAIGIDVSERYCELAATRCSQRLLPIDTDTHNTEQVEQLGF